MRQSNTATVELNTQWQGQFIAEPYEVAWASEAIYFIRTLEAEGVPGGLNARVQISPDGMHWCDEGTTIGPVNEPGLYSAPVNNFGGWLRLSCCVDHEAQFKLMVYLALKEG